MNSIGPGRQPPSSSRPRKQRRREELTAPPRRIAVYTSFTFSYLSRALVLVRTLRIAHPDWDVWACLVDLPPAGADIDEALAEFDHVMYAHDLGFQRFRAWLFKHNIVEACTAVKGKMLSYLLTKHYEKVIYFDPDIALFNPITNVVDALDSASIVLTPHQCVPNQSYGAFKDNELTSMNYGIYNLGFVAVRKDQNAVEFAHWWDRVLCEACYDDLSTGIFTDQKYCDLVPALFDGVHVCRDSGCNVASWNLSTRIIKFDPNGNILVSGSPLKFYHFTKMNSEGDIMTDKYAGQNTEVIEVWNWYKSALYDIKLPSVPKGYWAYSTFDNGQKITMDARKLFRNRLDLYQTFDDPYAVSVGSYYEWLGREEPSLLSSSLPLAA